VRDVGAERVMTPDPDAVKRPRRTLDLPGRAPRPRPDHATAGLAVSALPPPGIDGAVQPAHARVPGALRLPVQTLPQPDETTCGPTCLHAVYRYWGESASLKDVIARTHRLEEGGTFAVFLGCDALRNGYRAALYTYNVTVFDPTWFTQPGVDIADRLRRQREAKETPRLRNVTDGYLEFLERGGRLRFADLSPALVRGLLRFKLPIITGLSSTYLYRARREYGAVSTPDDVRGVPVGHFVVIAGHDPQRRRVLVVDPYQPHPYGKSHEYWISIDRAVAAILLGIVTHDANLLVVYPRRRAPAPVP
jgi:hypothetical protein